ncbi:hypothetical protein ACIRPK_33475 [Kitasatospora sp. NPDC101801]|uniref:hypothetical protein n=1 Tax=Kitasatospora sp. NPDC101801 TaxID=3364103 RepID=UPI0038146B41
MTGKLARSIAACSLAVTAVAVPIAAASSAGAAQARSVNVTSSSSYSYSTGYNQQFSAHTSHISVNVTSHGQWGWYPGWGWGWYYGGLWYGVGGIIIVL